MSDKLGKMRERFAGFSGLYWGVFLGGALMQNHHDTMSWFINGWGGIFVPIGWFLALMIGQKLYWREEDRQFDRKYRNDLP